jgi:hypothetical protein
MRFMESAGDSPTGTAVAVGAKAALALELAALPIRSGGSPDGTGWSPVLLKTEFSQALRLCPPMPRRNCLRRFEEKVRVARKGMRFEIFSI